MGGPGPLGCQKRVGPPQSRFRKWTPYMHPASPRRGVGGLVRFGGLTGQKRAGPLKTPKKFKKIRKRSVDGQKAGWPAQKKNIKEPKKMNLIFLKKQQAGSPRPAPPAIADPKCHPGPPKKAGWWVDLLCHP